MPDISSLWDILTGASAKNIIENQYKPEEEARLKAILLEQAKPVKTPVIDMDAINKMISTRNSK